MADVSLLLAQLRDYHAVLEGQHHRIAEAERVLATRYRALSEVWAGAGADEFKHEWHQVMQALDAYREGVPAVLALLNDKTEQLSRLDEGY